ncbi:MAG: hypothetical protein ABUS57_22665, partial [Pseudomonadota bacterium]
MPERLDDFHLGAIAAPTIAQSLQALRRLLQRHLIGLALELHVFEDRAHRGALVAAHGNLVENRLRRFHVVARISQAPLQQLRLGALLIRRRFAERGGGGLFGGGEIVEFKRRLGEREIKTHAPALRLRAERAAP